MTIDERMREAARDVHRAAEAVPDRKLSKSKRPRALAGVVAFVVVLVVAVPAFLLSGGPGADPSAPTSGDRNLDTSEIPNEVGEYWSLEGTLESISDEQGWLCPPEISIGYTAIVGAEAIPADLHFELPGQSPIDTYLRDDGPSCSQPPALVMLSSADGRHADATSGMAVWPSTTRFEDTCPLDRCAVGDDEGSSLEELTINDQPATLYTRNQSFRLWWVDQGGVPLYGEASGISRQELLAAVESIEANPTTRTIEADEAQTGPMLVVAHEASVGVWEPGYWRSDTYQIDGTSVSVRVRYDSGWTPNSRFASAVSFLDLVEANGAPAVWIPEGGNFLVFESSDGVVIQIEGASTVDQAIAIAEDLERAY